MSTTDKKPVRYFFYNDPLVTKPLREQHPDADDKTFKALLKEQWKTLSEEEKEKYKQMHKDQDLRHAQSSPVQVSSHLVSNPPTETTTLVAKRPRNAYIHYKTNPEVIEKAKEQDSSLKGKSLTSYLAKKWNEMSEEEKQPWVDKYNQEKQELLENPIMTTKKVKSKQVKTKQTYKQPKSALESYLMDHPDDTTDTWNSMTPEQQQPWIDKHLEEKEKLHSNPILIKPSTTNIDQLFELVLSLQKEVANLKSKIEAIEE